ncbi:putative transcription initiation factor IIE subunit alpha, TFIIEalpha/SarR/Rpc3 HTH [Lupinus albus]|uniref:Putative transcription initiation factor IIE subunit alpha, TFIIEalpha/SarR/Rpc3 HTH n=1 Tax=Lupinus albus TaxID=3870 RepID=A0A6A4PL51_LUPAL|nr:putative transcription initiation factor IIE subunit alpha, TFIIEalpha/SarR/Rpc3 HTH [Lupinus albus]
MTDHYNKLVKLAARAFYDDLPAKSENQPKTGRSDNRGIAVVILDALTRRQWVREEDFAKDLKLHTKQLRRTLRFFEEEKIIAREYRRETAKGAKIYSAAVAATADGQTTKEGEEKVKLHTHSYCCLDYAQIYDVVRYRLHRMKHKLKDELENKNTIQEYICPDCGKRYNALDALRLISFEDEDFHCENCNGRLEIESDKIAAQEGGDGDDNARRRRREKLKDMLQKMEIQLKPLVDQLSRVKDLPVPEFGSLQSWEALASAAGRAANGDNAGDSRNSQLGYNGAPMPYSGDTKVVVDFNGTEGKGEGIKSETDGKPVKVLPPWMIRSGMVLTEEQRGEVKQETKMDGTSTSSTAQYTEDKKSKVEHDTNTNIQDEYIKAYYAALLKQQHELAEAAKKEELSNSLTTADDPPSSISIRQVGMKTKRDEDDDGTEWEDAPIGGNGNGSYKAVDLNVEADEAAADDDDEDIDWEEG